MTEILQGKKFKCAFCGGRGIQPHSLSSKCMSCRGKGEVEFEGPVIECPACQGSGRVSRSLILSCIRCRGAGVVEKDEKAAGEGAADIIEERLGEIAKRLQSIQPFAEEIKKEVKKDGLCLKELGNKVKKAWVSLWQD